MTKYTMYDFITAKFVIFFLSKLLFQQSPERCADVHTANTFNFRLNNGLTVSDMARVSKRAGDKEAGLVPFNFFTHWDSSARVRN